MATRAWLGTESNNGQTAGNWSGGAVPIAGDAIVGDARAQRALEAGTDFSGILFTDVHFHSDYPYALGSSGSPFKVRCAELLWAGQGAAFLNAAGGSVSRAIIDTDAIEAVTMADNSGAFTKIEWLKGRGSIFALTNIDLLFVTYRDNPPFDSRVTLQPLNGIDAIHQNAGTLISQAAVAHPLIVLSGGLFEIQESGFGAGTVATAVHQSGGVMRYRQFDEGSVITNYYHHGGYIDVEGTTATQHVITNLYRFPGSEIPKRDMLNIANEFKIGVP